MEKTEFRKLYDENYRSLLAYTNRMTGDVNVSKDLVQDAMVKAYHSLDSLDDKSKFKPWAATIVRNLFINQYKKKKRRENLKTTTKFKINVVDRTAVNNDGVHQLNTDFIMDNIRTLKPIYKTPLMMHANGYSYQEIAEQNEVPLGTVKSRISTGRNILKQKLVSFGYVPAA